MKNTIVLISIVGAFGLCRCSSDSGEGDAPEEEAQEVAMAWLALLDSGRYYESWDEAAELIKQAVTREEWRLEMEDFRTPLGANLSRTVMSRDFRTAFQGAPPGEYVVISISSSFENDPSVIETITPMLEQDGTWRVAGYYISL